MSREQFRDYFDESMGAKRAFFDACGADVVRVGEKIKAALHGGHKLLICGNGGSAADAQHLAAELVCRFEVDRRAWPAIALTTDTSVLTAQSNDQSFDTIFSRQIEALGQRDDVLIAISTSGNSSNIVTAARVARQLRVVVVGMLGRDGGQLKSLVDDAVIVPSDRTAYIQECHQMAYHFWCQMIEG